MGRTDVDTAGGGHEQESSPAVELGSRLAWLLRVSRAAGVGVDETSEFVAQLSARGVVIDEAAVRTLEADGRSVTAEVIVAYERVLGLRDRSLLGPCEAMSRVLVGRALQPTRVLPTPEVRRELDRVAEVVRHGQPAGADWLSLAQLLTQPDGVVLPGFLEDDWLYRLVDELARSVGDCYLSRSEALARIMTDELHALRLVTLIRERVQESGAQASTDVLSIWGTGRDSASVDAAISLLGHEDATIRRGASVALLRRVAMGRLDRNHLDRVAATLRGLAGAHAGALSEEALALERRVATELGAEPAPGSSGDPATDEPVQRVLDTLAATIAADPDPGLCALLRDVLSDRHPERRPRAGLMIGASPYAPAIAEAALKLQQDEDSSLAHRGGRLVTALARHLSPEQVTPLLDAADPQIRRSGLIALAHGPGTPHDLDLEGLLEDPDTAAAAVYSAGMSQHPALEVASRARSAEVRLAARWWQEHGGRITEDEQERS